MAEECAIWALDANGIEGAGYENNIERFMAAISDV